MWWAKELHCFSEEFQCRFAIPALGDKAFQHLAIMIHSPPELVGFAVDFYEKFVQVPLSSRVCMHPVDPFSSDLRGEHRAEPVPPEPHRLMANIDTAFV